MVGRGQRGRARIVGGAIAFGAVACAGVALAAPAEAALQSIAVDTLPGYGSSANGSFNYGVYGAGCAYELSVLVGDPGSAKSNLKVTLVGAGRTVTIYDKKPTSSEVRPTWRPSTPGRYVLKATLDGVEKTRAVTVGTGVQLPDFIRNGSCFVLPTY
ncbi:hypothetical protein [Gordonia terrae]|uniref:hypothetical protein n=1 Tax=Gordonia terrae TaxID=2055 RepID=UPI0015DFD50D|nr:hypothetical protein [Gordonia terrae]